MEKNEKLLLLIGIALIVVSFVVGRVIGMEMRGTIAIMPLQNHLVIFGLIIVLFAVVYIGGFNNVSEKTLEENRS